MANKKILLHLNYECILQSPRKKLATHSELTLKIQHPKLLSHFQDLYHQSVYIKSYKVLHYQQSKKLKSYAYLLLSVNLMPCSGCQALSCLLMLMFWNCSDVAAGDLKKRFWEKRFSQPMHMPDLKHQKQYREHN